jgi:hypothetical protein
LARACNLSGVVGDQGVVGLTRVSKLASADAAADDEWPADLLDLFATNRVDETAPCSRSVSPDREEEE